MKRRSVTIPVLNAPTSFAIIGAIFCLSLIAPNMPSWFHSFISIFIWFPSAWNFYSGVRRLGYDNKPVTLTIGKKIPELTPEPETRQPLAFPPDDNQCFVCGNYDYERQDVFGDAAHATCREWLGDWKIPNWVIYYREYNHRTLTVSGRLTYGSGYYKTNLAHLPGTTTRQQIIDYCNNDPGLIRYLSKGLFAELVMPDGGNTIKFDIPEPQEPIAPELAEAFYNNKGMTADEWLMAQYRKSLLKENE